MNEVERHSVGATVTHHGPFSGLVVTVIDGTVPGQLRSHWVKPLYRGFLSASSRPAVTARIPEMTEDVARQLLSYFDWRPRIVGAHIVALRKYAGLTELVGRLLLRSDVCYAGTGYCYALARINTAESRKFLHDYLDYYLTKPDLWFDQGSAIAAVAFLDKVNGSHELDQHLDTWAVFAGNQPNWDLGNICTRFEQNLDGYAALDCESTAT